MEHFVIIVNDWKPLTIITKSSILDVAAVLDPSLITITDELLNILKTIGNIVLASKILLPGAL